MCDFDSASAAKRPVLLVMSRSVTCRISTISVRATTRGSTPHTQISSLRQQRGQCPLKSCGVVERMALAHFFRAARAAALGRALGEAAGAARLGATVSCSSLRCRAFGLIVPLYTL